MIASSSIHAVAERKNADRDIEDSRVTHILRTGEPCRVTYPDETEDETEYIKDEMRFEQMREERLIE